MNAVIREPTTSETACSSACVRAGITSLISAALAITLLAPLEKQEPLDALAAYLQLRFQLSEAADQISRDPCWQHIKELIGADAEGAWSLNRVSTLSCMWTDPDILAFAGRGPDRFYSLPASRHSGIDFADLDRTLHLVLRPSPLTGLRPPTRLSITGSNVYAGVQLANAMRELSDPKLLAAASNVNNQSSVSIHEWTAARWSLAIAHQSVSPETPRGYIAIVYAENDGKEITKSDAETDLNWLTIADSIKLSKEHPASLEAFEKAANDVNEVKLPILQATFRMKMATLAVEVVLLVTLLWFLLNMMKLGSYGDRGQSTVLSLFEDNRFTMVLFALAVFVVAVPAGLLALKSFPIQKLNMVIAAASVLTARSILTRTGWPFFRAATKASPTKD